LAINEAIDLNDRTYARQLRAAALLERVETRQPNHPGVAHYLIHSYDYAPLAERGLPAARRYARLAPSAPHALHMPSHTFSTLGLWREAIQADLASDARAVAYTAEVNPQLARTPMADPRRYHSFDFLANAYLQLAQEEPVRRMVEGLREVGS